MRSKTLNEANCRISAGPEYTAERECIVIVHRKPERRSPEPTMIPMPITVLGNDNAAYDDANANKVQPQTSNPNPYSNELPSAPVAGAVGGDAGEDGYYGPDTMYESIQ